MTHVLIFVKFYKLREKQLFYTRYTFSGKRYLSHCCAIGPTPVVFYAGSNDFFYNKYWSPTATSALKF